MRVARTFADKVVLAQGEDLQDVLVGCALLATRRSSVYGRAPAAPDLRWALELWGFLESSAPTELVAARTQAFASVAHHYVSQRALVDRIPPEVLGLTPEAVVARRQDWRELTGS